MKYLVLISKLAIFVFLIILLSKHNEWPQLASVPAYLALAVGNYLAFAIGTNAGLTILKGIYRRRKRMDSKQVDNVIIGLDNIYLLLLVGATLLTVFSFFGIHPRELFTSLTIVAAAIAIISKDFISEIISGMIIAFSKEISLDDNVKIGDKKGKVIDITLTKIALLNEDDDIIYIPNNKVHSSEIVNYTRKEIRKVSIEFELNIQALRTTVEELENDLRQAISEYRQQIEPDSYNLKIVEIKKDNLVLKFQYVIKRPNRELEREIRRKTVRQVVNYVRLNLPGTIPKSTEIWKGSEEKELPPYPITTHDHP